VSKLSGQAVRGLKWSSLQTIIVGLTGPVALLIKSRFLLPDDFAYLSIVMICIGLFQLLETFGISQAIIQKDLISREESSSIFYFNMLFSALLAVFVFFSSSMIADFFSLPRLDYYLEVVSIIVLINGPSLLFRAFLEKEMYIKQLAVINILRNGINVIFIFLLLNMEFGVIGVIYAQIISTVFATIAIILYSIKFMTFRIGLYFRFSALSPFLRFGAFVSGKQLLTFATHRLDEVVIGYLLAPEVLGVYHFGKNMLEKIRNLMTNSFSKVLFPVFSKLKFEPEKLKKAYHKVSHFIALGAFPTFIGIAVTAHLFVPVVFGDKWSESIIVFQVFSVTMIFLLLTANVASALLYSVKKPDLVFYIDLFTNGFYFVLLFLFANKGLIYILGIYSGYIIYKTLILQYFVSKQLRSKMSRYLKEMIVPALISIVMAAGILVFQFFTQKYFDNVIMLIGSIFIGFAVYILLIYLISPGLIQSVRSIMKMGSVDTSQILDN
jgi:O-antigen/teichoic acid export membrane protein